MNERKAYCSIVMVIILLQWPCFALYVNISKRRINFTFGVFRGVEPFSLFPVLINSLLESFCLIIKSSLKKYSGVFRFVVLDIAALNGSNINRV